MIARMGALKWIIVALVLIEAGWMAFDGSRALVVGDYVTPRSGRYAGQLGPWSKVVTAAGIEPRSTLMKSIFALYGIVWLVAAALLLVGVPWARWALVALAAGALLPFGTLLSLVQVVLLLIMKPPHAGA
jgi:hypothetical protein